MAPETARTAVACAAIAALVTACGNEQAPTSPSPQARAPGGEQTDQERVDPAPPAFADFDRDEARAEAEALLGVGEADLDEHGDLRIVRRGDESRPVTMDLRPGRMNVELDEDDTGAFVVTRIVVETPDSDDRLIVD